MYHVDLYRRVRLACHHEGLSHREAARRFGIDRKTVSKILKHSTPPGYQRRHALVRPKLDPYIGVINQILESDKGHSKKHRHTAKRIFERLRDDHGFTGSLTIVTDYVREKKRKTKEVFVPLWHAPGHAQADFGESWAFIDGVKLKVHYFVLALPQSDACFVKAYPRETTEVFFATGMSRRLVFWAASPFPSFTTIRRLRWRRSPITSVSVDQLSYRS